jgi:hypothetical protein
MPVTLRSVQQTYRGITNELSIDAATGGGGPWTGGVGSKIGRVLGGDVIV